jgi:trk system potassium uptake protein TrkA
VFSAGNGEVQLYEINVPAEWTQHSVRDLLPASGATAMSLVRCGKASLPESNTVLQPQDILHISATGEGIAVLRQRLHDNGNGNGSVSGKE